MMLEEIERQDLSDKQELAVKKIERLQEEGVHRLTKPPAHLSGYYYYRSPGDVMLHFEDVRIIVDSEGGMKLTLPKMFV